MYPECELVHLQLWLKLYCQSELTYLVQVDRQEMHIFVDSVDAGTVNGNSPPQIDDLELEPALAGMKLSLDSSSPNKPNSSSSAKSFLEIKTSIGKKTRSFEDFSKSFKMARSDDSKDSGTRFNLVGSIDDATNLDNGDPVHIRSSSESNLLMDALQNISSSSPKANNMFFDFEKHSNETKTNSPTKSNNSTQISSCKNLNATKKISGMYFKINETFSIKDLFQFQQANKIKCP